jgi:hypothetical protein
LEQAFGSPGSEVDESTSGSAMPPGGDQGQPPAGEAGPLAAQADVLGVSKEVLRSSTLFQTRRPQNHRWMEPLFDYDHIFLMTFGTMQ